jgi:hypothetical protein
LCCTFLPLILLSLCRFQLNDSFSSVRQWATLAIVIQGHNQQRLDNRPGVVRTYNDCPPGANSNEIRMMDRKFAAICQTNGEWLKGLSV